MWIREIGSKVVQGLTVLPLQLGIWHARLLSFASQAVHGIQRKAIIAATGGSVVGLLAVADEVEIAALLATIGSVPLFARLGSRGRRNRQRRRIANSPRSVDGLPPARQTLLEMGLDEAAADRIAAVAPTSEVRLATFDDDNRVLSHIGPIPHFDGVLITPEQFRERERHRLELVIARGVVCVKKMYRDQAGLDNELLALHAVAGIPGVPRLVAVQLQPRIVYQSFIVGENLGSLMARRGASVSIQHQVSVSFSGSRRNPDAPAPAREAALAALSASVAPGMVSKLAHLIKQIHERGVTIGDIKYGNVLLADGQPFLCDFDHAAVFPGNSWRCVWSRAIDRDKFNYFFDGRLLSEREFRSASALLASQKEDLLSPRIYYGYGHASPPTGAFKLGSGQWRLIRPHLPDLTGRSVLDLSCRTGLMSLEMLRAGARRVTAYEPDAILASYSRLNHQWLEFVDNRRYPAFQLLEDSPYGACVGDWTGYDMATDFHGFQGAEPEEVARIVSVLSRSVDCIVVRAARPHDEDSGLRPGQHSLSALGELLRANGYPAQTIVNLPFDDRPLLIGRRAAR